MSEIEYMKRIAIKWKDLYIKKGREMEQLKAENKTLRGKVDLAVIALEEIVEKQYGFKSHILAQETLSKLEGNKA